MSYIEEVLRLKTELDKLRPISAEEEARIMQKFRLDWNYHSNHLEGNSLTFGETRMLLLFGTTAGGKPLKDSLEITGHNEAINLVLDVIKQSRPLTEGFIRELHSLILKEPYLIDAITKDGKPTKKLVEIGKYKTLPNHVETKTGEIFYFAKPEETPAKMADLMSWYKEEVKEKKLNPIILAAKFHYDFIRIHPFDDGNGRTARLLMNFILMQFGFPPAIIKSEDKENYFYTLRQGDVGEIKPFIEYIAKNVANSLEIMIKGAKGEDIEEPIDLDKKIALLEQKIKFKTNKIKVSKSKEAILSIFDDSFVRIYKQFVATCKKFDGFYLNTHFTFILPSNIESRPSEYNEQTVRDVIDHNIQYIGLHYGYRSQKDGFDSDIFIYFSDDGYEIKDRHSNKIIKSYYEQLTDEEINHIIKAESERHLKFIEENIAKNE
jgi:Fic family protein